MRGQVNERLKRESMDVGGIGTKLKTLTTYIADKMLGEI